MHKSKGMFHLLLYNIIKEYNPEIFEKVKDKLIKEEEINPEEFYPAENTKQILREFSPEALEAIGKRAFPFINETTGAFKGVTDPAPIFNAYPAQYLENNFEDEGKDIGKYEPPEVEEGRAVIIENTAWPSDLTRGIAMGIVHVAGIKTAVRGKTELIKEGDLPTYKHTIVWK